MASGFIAEATARLIGNQKRHSSLVCTPECWHRPRSWRPQQGPQGGKLESQSPTGEGRTIILHFKEKQASSSCPLIRLVLKPLLMVFAFSRKISSRHRVVLASRSLARRGHKATFPEYNTKSLPIIKIVTGWVQPFSTVAPTQSLGMLEIYMP